VVVLPDAVAQYSAVVVVAQYATLANVAVRSRGRSPKLAGAAPFTFGRWPLGEQRKALLAHALVVAITLATVTVTVSATATATATATVTANLFAGRIACQSLLFARLLVLSELASAHVTRHHGVCHEKCVESHDAGGGGWEARSRAL
jgi:hypothetical protein